MAASIAFACITDSGASLNNDDIALGLQSHTCQRVVISLEPAEQLESEPHCAVNYEYSMVSDIALLSANISAAGLPERCSDRQAVGTHQKNIRVTILRHHSRPTSCDQTRLNR
jgi:hypothetical protein